MVKIVICDDDPSIRNLLNTYLDRFAKANDCAFAVKMCDDGDALLRCAPCDIILLDIDMPGLDGMSAARTLREKDANVIIIFITNLVQYAMEGYEVQAYHFIKKPTQYAPFAHVMKGALQMLSERSDTYLSIKNESGMHRIRTKDILFVETARGHVLLHTVQKETECFQTMTQTEQALGTEHFFRCHTSYLINLAMIEQLGSNEVLLKSGYRIPVSKHRRRKLAEAITDYWGGRLL